MFYFFSFPPSQVSSDAEALKLMNDSAYGLTASIWTSPTDEKSIAAFHALADDLESESKPALLSLPPKR